MIGTERDESLREESSSLLSTRYDEEEGCDSKTSATQHPAGGCACEMCPSGRPSGRLKKASSLGSVFEGHTLVASSV